MATYKRRVVYLSDDEWAALETEAHERRTTISALIRGRLQGGGPEPVAAERGETSGGPPKGARAASSGMRQARGFGGLRDARKPSQRRS
jgi:hypothetical protein